MKPSERFRSLCDYWSERASLPADLVWRQIGAESSYAPTAVSPVGAKGLMQLMPGTWEMFNCRDPFDPDENIRCGTTWDATILYKFVLPKSSLDRADPFALRMMLAGYNAGPGYVVATLIQAVPKDWDSFKAAFRNIQYKGKRPDWKQATEYAEKIVPLT